jgi:uncharacterized protein (DUF433 family)
MGNSERIVKTPGVCGGRTRIAGHRVRVLDIVSWHEHQGMPIDEIVSHIPSLTLAEVHAALVYYFDHNRGNPTEHALAEELRQNHPSLVKTKLRQDLAS